MLLPVLVAILAAKTFADAIEPHSFYHSIMDAARMPFLPPKPHTRVNTDLLPVSAVMAAPVVTITRSVKLGEVERLLRDRGHNGFPVVQAKDGSSGKSACVGLVTRNDLLVRAAPRRWQAGSRSHCQPSASDVGSAELWVSASGAHAALQSPVKLAKWLLSCRFIRQIFIC